MHSRTHPLPDEPVMTRREAFDAGLKKYWTGKPCNRGHVALRNVRTGACCDCLRFYADARQDDGLYSCTVRIPATAAGALADFVAALVLAHQLSR